MPLMCAPRRLALVAPLALLALGLGTAGTPLAAQEMRSLQPTRELEFWGGLAQGSPQWGILGETPGMNLAIFAFRIARPIGGPAVVGASRSTTFHVDLIPFALISPPYVSLEGRPGVDCARDTLCVAQQDRGPGLFPNGSATGIGFSPIGFTTHFRQNRTLSPSFGVTGGALLFHRAAPTTRAAHFNFTAAIEAGVRVGPPDRTGVLLIYRFHHISNAGMAPENPGVASHLFTIGLRSARRPVASEAR